MGVAGHHCETYRRAGVATVRRMHRELWLLRHGKAEAPGAGPDAARALTGRGEREARAAGVLLRERGVVPEVVFASPRVRAWETARLAGEALDLEPVEHAPLGGGFDADGALQLAAGHGVVLLVGHQPDIGQIVYDLTGARAELRPGALAGITLGTGGGVLTTLIGPVR